MKIILATTDFSPNSENALYYAAELAQAVGASLYLMHVYSIPIPVSEAPVPVVDVSQIEEDALTQLNKFKRKINQQIGNGLPVELILRSGNVNWEIEEFCKQLQPYVVVMGAESSGPVGRVLFGAKTLNAISRLEWPVMIIPPGVSFTNLQRIGLACDFRQVLDTVPVNEIRDLVKKFNAEFHILHASMDSTDSMNPETVEESAWIEDLLGDLHPKYHFIKDKNTDKAIARFADEYQLDLLIVIPKKHGILERIFEHSHSKSLVLHSHIPVMSIHE